MKKGRLKEIVAELQGASKMHLKQSKEIAAHIDDMASPAKMTSPLKRVGGISGLFGLAQKVVPKNGTTIKAAADITFDDVASAAWDIGSLALRGGANVTAMMLTPTKSYGGTMTDDPAWKAANPELQQDKNWKYKSGETELLTNSDEPLDEKYTNKDHPEYNALNEQTKYYEKEQYKKNNPPKEEPVYRTEADRALANSPGPWEDKLLAQLGKYGENNAHEDVGDGAPNETNEMLNMGIRTMNPIKKVRDHTNTNCWKSKVKIGTKMSRTNPGVRVNDCVDPSSPRAKNK